jgi:hypothetical protein
VDVTMTSGNGDAGMVFRVTAPANGTDSYRGYYAGLSPRGQVILGRADNGWTPLRSAAMPVAHGRTYHLRVTATGSSIRVYVDDMTTPRISVTDTTFPTGANGVRVFNTAATFDNIAVRPAQR